MNLADHIRPLLRDHDCVIIPGFGGLVADFAPARLHPGRHLLSAPTKQVAFNQALTRNDGLLVDALAQHLHLPAAQAHELLRQAVARLNEDLQATHRTELPGIGVFRRAAGRGLSFEYTGSDNLLPAAYGLPELTARPVRAADARRARVEGKLPTAPMLRPARARLAKLLPGAAVAVVVTLIVSANYLFSMQAGYLPASWRVELPQVAWSAAKPAPKTTLASAPTMVPQQAAIAQHDWSTAPAAEAVPELGAATPEPQETVATTVPTPTVTAPVTIPAKAPAAVPTPAESALTTSKETTTAVANRLTTAPVVASKSVDKATESKVTAKAATPVVATPATAPAAAAYSTTINSPTGRYYIMGGSFKTMAVAEIQRKRLTALGHRARVLVPRTRFGERLYKVSVDDYADNATAQREAQRMRTQTRLGKDLWILTY